MNHWFWFSIIIVPLLVFSIKPEADANSYIARTIGAWALCYGLLFLTINWQYDIESQAIDAFHKEFPAYDVKLCHDEPRMTVSGELLGFAYVLGWIPALGYVGMWELMWRLYYRKRTRYISKNFTVKWVSNMLIVFAVLAAYPTWLFLSRLSA